MSIMSTFVLAASHTHSIVKLTVVLQSASIVFCSFFVRQGRFCCAVQILFFFFFFFFSNYLNARLGIPVTVLGFPPGCCGTSSIRLSMIFFLSCCVTATMKRRIEAPSAPPQAAKRLHEESSSDEESQLSRQGRYINFSPSNNVCSDKRAR